MKKMILRIITTITFVLLMMLNVSYIQDSNEVNLTLVEANAAIEDEATCYSTYKDCAWWSSCWNTWRCGTCESIETRKRDDEGICTF